MAVGGKLKKYAMSVSLPNNPTKIALAAGRKRDTRVTHEFELAPKMYLTLLAHGSIGTESRDALGAVVARLQIGGALFLRE